MECGMRELPLNVHLRLLRAWWLTNLRAACRRLVTFR
jgi:hypothetical protein